MPKKSTKKEKKVKAKVSGVSEMTPKQRLFGLEYLIDLNATQAAIRAGYSEKTAQEQGSRLLSKVMVAAFIKKQIDRREERLGVTADELLLELATLCRSNIKDFVTFDAKGVVTIIGSEQLTREQAACISEVSQVATEKSTSFNFKLYDKLKAISLVGKHRDVQAFLDKSRHELTGKDGEPLELSDIERATRIDALLDLARKRGDGHPPDGG